MNATCANIAKNPIVMKPMKSVNVKKSLLSLQRKVSTPCAKIFLGSKKDPKIKRCKKTNFVLKLITIGYRHTH